MYTAKCGETAFEIAIGEEGITVDGKEFPGDIKKLDENLYSVIYDHKSFVVELVRADSQTKAFLFRVNNTFCEVGVKNKFDLLLEKLGMNNSNAGKVNVIKAPMPGLIIDLRVKEGDEVKHHDPLVVLEAMKMENVIKSPGDGVVRKVCIIKGQGVEKNQVLIEF